MHIVQLFTCSFNIAIIVILKTLCDNASISELFILMALSLNNGSYRNREKISGCQRQREYEGKEKMVQSYKVGEGIQKVETFNFKMNKS